MLADHGIQRNSRSALMASTEVLFAGPLQLCHSPKPICQHHRVRHQQQLCLIKLEPALTTPHVHVVEQEPADILAGSDHVDLWFSVILSILLHC